MIPDLALRDVRVREMPWGEPADVFAEHRPQDYSALLTGRGLPDLARHSFVASRPLTLVRYAGSAFELETGDGVRRLEAEFWPILKATLARTAFDEYPAPAALCGGIGYLSYEALHAVERLRKRTRDDYTMPWLEWVFYNRYIVFDHRARKAFLVEPIYASPSRIERPCIVAADGAVRDLRAECDRAAYVEKVRRIQEYILEGDVYEVNLSQQLRGRFQGDAFALFRRLYAVNDAPFSAFLAFGPLQVVCNSPELFLRAEGAAVETRPIKGTIRRGRTPEEDEENRRRLLASEKDQAELFMIVDLLRNDLGRVCEYGSVRVAEAKRIETYRNVHHLVGIVAGRLRPGTDYFDLLRATFPGGSVTGCPKVRCLEIIEELETYSRNLYTGTIFLMNRRRLTANIVIRTAVATGGGIYLNSGGAVTIDSDPDAEYEETAQKLRNLLEAIGHAGVL